MARDYLDEIVAKRTARNPRFPRMVEEAIARQDQARTARPDRDTTGESGAPVAPERRRLTARHGRHKTKV